MSESVTTILIAEDEPNIRKPLAASLERDGYRCLQAGDGPRALELAESSSLDLVVLDLMLPGMDGFSVCRAIRRHSQVPILILTARDGESDQILGFELGADDYVTKPFSLGVLKSRIRSLLRRTSEGSAQDDAEVLRHGPLEVDVTRHRVTLDGHEIELTSTEFDLLAYLARAPGRAFTRQQLLENVWGYHFEGYQRTVDSHVRRLRKKLGSNPKEPRFVETVFKVGYRFRDDV
jgi:DNA-binding response OmpR family regulator